MGSRRGMGGGGADVGLPVILLTLIFFLPSFYFHRHYRLSVFSLRNYNLPPPPSFTWINFSICDHN
jgi:hypothetical protein